VSIFKETYFCGECKKVVKTLEELLFVENDGQVGFCSEPCIENFYSPLVEKFEGSEKVFRSEKLLGDEDILEVIGHPVYMDQVLRRPDEVWCSRWQGGERVYSFINHLDDEKFGKFTMMVICLVYDNQPSFIISASATRSQTMVKEYQWGKKVKNLKDYHSSSEVNEKKKHIEIDEQMMMEVEGKKSAYLASLLEERSPADIPVESFGLYDQYFEPTMMSPDEIYSHKDREGDTIYTYIKAHDREGVSFYFFIVCLRLKEGIEENTDALVPIVSFPSVDGEMYRLYKKGDLVSGNLKN